MTPADTQLVAPIAAGRRGMSLRAVARIWIACFASVADTASGFEQSATITKDRLD